MRWKILFLSFCVLFLSSAAAPPDDKNSNLDEDASGSRNSYGPITGVEGKNYNMSKTGFPYIICNFYHQGHDHSHDGEVLPGGEAIKCYQDHSKDERLGCFSVFRYNQTDEYLKTDNNTKSTLMLLTSGCWTHPVNGEDHCVLDDKCVHNDPITQSPMFCCCIEHNCNKEVYMEQHLPERKAEMRNIRGPLEDQPKNAAEPGRSEEQETFQPINIVIMAIVALTIIFGAVFLYMWWKRRTSGKKGKDHNVEALPLVQMKPKRETALEPESVFEITDMTHIGRGRFGAVSSATWTKDDGSTCQIAVKSFSKMDRGSFDHEISIYILPTMKDCRCAHILRYLGWMSGFNGDLWLITEIYSMGNLKEYLEQNVLTKEQSFRIMVTALEGLSYLHDERMVKGTHKPAIAHRDIKSKNILLKTEQGEIHAVIGDFGLAMKLDGSLTSASHGQVGTRRYMAPEVLEGAQQFTASAFRQVDVYAMGLVIWELLLRTQLNSEDVVPAYKAPFEAEMPGNPSLFQMREAVVLRKIRPEFREELNTDQDLEQVATTCQEMWHAEAEGRVTAGCAMERLQKILGMESEGYYSGTSLKEPRTSTENEQETPQIRQGATRTSSSNPAMQYFPQVRAYIPLEVPAVPYPEH